MKKLLLYVSMVLVISMIFTGCGPSGATSSDSDQAGASEGEMKIAFIGTSNTDESIIHFSNSAIEEGKRLGVNITVFDPNNDVQKQINTMEDCISDKYDGIIMIPIDPQAIVPAAKKVHEAGLKLIILAADIDESGAQYRDYCVTADHYVSGELCGEAVLKQFPNGAKGVMIEGHPGEYTQIVRTAGFEDVVEGSDIQLLDKKGCDGWDSAKALAVIEDFISMYGDEIEFIYSHWDNGSISIVQALEEKNMLDDIFIVSVDGCRAGFDLVNDGKIAATMYQDIPLQSQVSVQRMIQLLKGEKLDTDVEFIGWTVITKENADFDPGW